jgi:hypothetical protein
MPDQWTIDTLKQLLDREDSFIRQEIIAERRIVDEKFGSRDNAVALETSELARRLDSLNHAHELARQKEVDFIGREAFNTFTDRTADDFVILRKEIQTTAGAVNTAKEQAASALANALTEAGKLGEARFSRLEKSQSMMLGGLMLIGAIIPIITGVIVFFISHTH